MKYTVFGPYQTIVDRGNTYEVDNIFVADNGDLVLLKSEHWVARFAFGQWTHIVDVSDAVDAAPRLNLVNPISCDSGLTGRMQCMIVCSLDLKDGVVTGITIGEDEDIHISDGGRGLLCAYMRNTMDREKYPNWPNPEPAA